MDELHDHYVLQELVLHLILQLEIHDLRAPFHLVDRHAQTVQIILTQRRMPRVEYYEAQGFTAFRENQYDIQFEETDFEMDPNSEMMEIQILTMVAATYAPLRLDMHAKVEQITLQISEILSEEMELSLILKPEMIETDMVEMGDLQLVNENLQLL